MGRRAATKWLIAGMVTATIVALGASPTTAAPPPAPVSVVPLDASAGYFRADGVCPARTRQLDYSWRGAPNGTGRGQVSIGPGAFSVYLRMLAAGPGQAISVTLKCINSSGRVSARWGSMALTSGTGMLTLPSNAGTGRRIVYSLSAQQVWAVAADESVARSYLVSGRRMPLAKNVSQLGVFSVQHKFRFWCQGSICPNFVAFHRVTTGWLGFHEIPVRAGKPFEKLSELGQPRSGGCTRQSAADAAWLWDWTVIGDVVVVVD